MTDYPVLETERLVMRAPILSDFDAYAAFYASGASATIGGPIPKSDAWRLFASDAGHWALKGFGWWTVTKDGDVVGSVGFHDLPQHDDIEIGWNVYVPRQGIGKEAAQAALSWAAEHALADRIVSYINRENTASIALANALGAHREVDVASHSDGSAVYLHNLEGYRA
ncbi:GNAT family N-acetyltransferase [Marivita hallyeonensis]|uniref:Protein N-acetyltransferase, RimJ/RimL family n=1 Tax=Marivita hallyeonensis TaxID=996342 RepID=A0A1M5XEN7_9RHOB|nr:GNAT family N-acetyltransferase [Marivita hallyeonensis]SHH97964.1 Protein N-acetyltransferase, RimJ/RimL family [Marivita hallyeonensis]